MINIFAKFGAMRNAYEYVVQDFEERAPDGRITLHRSSGEYSIKAQNS
jgi:hypothetical protein